MMIGQNLKTKCINSKSFTKEPKLTGGCPAFQWRRTSDTAEPVRLQNIPDIRCFATLVPQTTSINHQIVS